MSQLIPGAVGQKELLRAARAQAITRDWSAVVGEILALHTEPDRYERGTVFVRANSSTWAQELRMREDTVLERLNQAAQEPLFKKLRVSLGPRHRDLSD